MFVVFSQSTDVVTNRVESIIGPFRSYDAAANWLRKHRYDDNRYWFGIRQLISQSEYEKIKTETV